MFDRFRDIVVSGDEKLMKPDPAIYRLALDRFGLARGRTRCSSTTAPTMSRRRGVADPRALFTDARRSAPSWPGLLAFHRLTFRFVDGLSPEGDVARWLTSRDAACRA